MRTWGDVLEAWVNIAVMRKVCDGILLNALVLLGACELKSSTRHSIG